MEPFRIRQANEADAESIGVVHRQSILDLPAGDYPPEIIAAWNTAPTPEAVQKYKDAIRLRKEIVWVAEVLGAIEGYSALVPDRNEVRAVYITGKVCRRGVGQALLRTLETQAMELGLPTLNLRSSTTAKSFYEKNGYKNLGKSFHKLRSGREMDCFIMEKNLPR